MEMPEIMTENIPEAHGRENEWPGLDGQTSRALSRALEMIDDVGDGARYPDSVEVGLQNASHLLGRLRQSSYLKSSSLGLIESAGAVLEEVANDPALRDEDREKLREIRQLVVGAASEVNPR